MTNRTHRRARLAITRVGELTATLADCIVNDRHLGASSELRTNAYALAHVLAGANEDDTPQVATRMLAGLVDGLCDWHETKTVIALLRAAADELESEVG